MTQAPRLNSFEEIVGLALHWSELRTQLAAIDRHTGAPGLKNLLRITAEQTLNRVEKNILEFLEKSQTVPPGLAALKPDVERMHLDAPFEHSVFLMTKFPDAPSASVEDEQLDSLTRYIEEALRPYGLVLRRADQRNYASSSQLWDNVRTHMLGCRYGIAILESKYRDEFNPNVALEYGFMQALGRDVVLFIEEEFKHRRADIIGTLGKSFKWSSKTEETEASIYRAVESWMIDLGRPKTNASI